MSWISRSCALPCRRFRKVHTCIWMGNSSSASRPSSGASNTTSMASPGQKLSRPSSGSNNYFRTSPSDNSSKDTSTNNSPAATPQPNTPNMPSYAKKPATHLKCRNAPYPRNKNIIRCTVPDDKLDWKVPCPEYTPVDFTGPNVAAKPVWADFDYKHEEGGPPVQWNALDDKVDRRSHMEPYAVVDNIPRNPVGRTGVCSRGHLGRWGPNHAADPIVTRWKRDEARKIIKDPKSGKPILQFVAIQRKDSGEWAIPGGMVSPGEAVSITLKREFSEETMNSLEASEDELEVISKQVHELFTGGTEVYRGYVDDPRNTDNAWMETVAVNFHDSSGDSVGRFRLHAGDDAGAVRWADMSSEVGLYASHTDFISQVVHLHSAHW